METSQGRDYFFLARLKHGGDGLCTTARSSSSVNGVADFSLPQQLANALPCSNLLGTVGAF